MEIFVYIFRHFWQCIYKGKTQENIMEARKILFIGTILLAAATIVGASILSQAIASAITQQNNTNSQNNMTFYHRASPLSNLTGSIQLGPTIKQAILSKVNISLDKAIPIAQQAVSSNSSVTSAFIRPLNGYLVYDIHVTNNNNNTLYAVIVDPGNGKILYNKALTSLSPSGQPLMFGNNGTGSSFGAYKGHGCHWSSGGRMMTNSGNGYFHNQYTHMSAINPDVLNILNGAQI
jgi:uncharacterized membrane protein YkoI